MNIEYLRSSSFNNWSLCQQQYFITYVLGHQFPANKAAEKGTCVHKVMECLAVCRKFIQDNDEPQNLRQLIEINDDAIGLIQISKNKLYIGKEFIDSLINKSYTYYSEDSTHEWDKKDYKDVYNWVWKALEFNNSNIFDPRFRNILKPEQGFDIEINEPWSYYEYKDPITDELKSGYSHIKGTIDLITKVDDSTIEVIDYKTGKYRKDFATGKDKDYEYLKTDPQLMIYHYALRYLYPQYKNIIITIFYIQAGGPFSICYEPEQVFEAEEILRKRFEEIRNNEMPKMLSNTQSDWRCQKICSLFKNKFPGASKNICLEVHKKLQEVGINETVKQYRKEGFQIGHYNAPGSK